MANIYLLRYKILVFIFLSLSLKVNSKQIDSLIFTSNFEKSIFLDFINTKKADPFNFFIAPNYSNNSELIKKSLNELYSSIEKSGFINQNKKKQIKTIYKKVYDLCLKNYSEEAVFSDIFKNGNYNCMAASGLFAIIFEHYKIDYSIKRTAVHIYILADPNGEKIAIETALPTKGLVEFDMRLKKGFVDYLKETKMISDYDYNTNTIDRLFEINYNKTTSINLIQLAGLQYFNWGIIQYKSFVYGEALKNFEKAEILFNDEPIKFLKNLTLINLLNEEATSNRYSGKNLAKFMNLNYQNLESLNFAKEYFGSITNELVINHPNVDAYSLFYSEYNSNLNDSASNSEIQLNYYNALGYYYYLNNEYQKSLSFVDKSYEINPDHVFTKQVITAVIERINNSRNNSFDSESMIDSLEQFIVKYSFIKNEKRILIELVEFYGNTIDTYLELGQLNKVDLLIDRLNKFIYSLNLKDDVNDFICMVYNKVSSHFYRIQLFDKADEYLRMGLKSYPNSNLLLTSQNNINELRNKFKYVHKGSLGLDAESYNVIKTLANNRKATINANIDRYLRNQKWKLGLYTFEDRIKTLPIKEQAMLSFDVKRNIKIVTSRGEKNGKWNYYLNDNTLRVTDSKDNLLLKLMIYDIDSSMIKTVRYSDENNTKVLILLKRM